MKIRTELFAVIAGVFLALSLLQLSLSTFVVDLQQEASVKQRHFAAQLKLAEGLESHYQLYEQSWKNILLRGHVAGKYQNYLQAFYQNERQLYNQMSLLIQTTPDDSQLKQIELSLRADLKRIGKQYRRGIQQYYDSTSPAHVIADKFIDSEQQLINHIADIKLHVVAKVQNANLDLNKGLNNSIQQYFTVAMAVILLCMLIITFLVHRRVIRPLEQATSVVERLDQHEQNLRMDELGQNEFANYARAFNALMDNLQQKQLQLDKTSSQLIEVEKFAALGELVAGVAHELNTPLGISLTAATHVIHSSKQLHQQLLDEKLTRKQMDDYVEQLLEGCRVIEGNLHKASEIIGTFKQVAVDQSSEKRRKFNLQKCLEENIFNMNLKHKRVEHDIQLHSVSVEMDSFPGPLGQVITNLVNNSFLHAFEEGHFGIIKIDARMITEKKVQIVYEDNGKGMTQEVLNKLFDPFFTTSTDNQGTGLGMPIIYNIVTNIMKGRISVTSEVGQFSRFTIVVPINVDDEG